MLKLAKDGCWQEAPSVKILNQIRAANQYQVLDWSRVGNYDDLPSRLSTKSSSVASSSGETSYITPRS